MLHGFLLRCVLVASTVLGLAALPLAAQDLRDFPYVDSLSVGLVEQGRWQALDSLGKAAFHVGTDYPALRQRLGYAALQLTRPADAVRHYGRALAANPADEESRTQLALAYLQMNQTSAARFAASTLPDSVRRPLHLVATKMISGLDFDLGFRPAANEWRGVAGYGRLGVSSQLATRLSLEQTLGYYGQTVELPDFKGSTPYAIRQVEYQGLLTLQASLPVQVKLGYHYIDNSFAPSNEDFGSRFRKQHYASHLGYTAVQYSRPAWNVKLGFYAGQITDTTRTQADVLVTLYPLHSLRFYTFGRASVVRSSGRTFPNALIGMGTQVRPGFWLEGFWSPGKVPVLAELDGAYVYNLLDPLKYRLGLNAYWQLTKQWRLRVHYTVARYFQISSPDLYTQHALTGGLSWTW
ncbi:bacterial transcriptional activator domain-containing protein [Hymenobacter sp. GOD-10R]|uniref:tetratricopeptide repeat protein n=1 Tax=Hymenobacter sp. GOD-10R TaxID=3093922 RepID=UPI002D784ADE|nr:bacterial transcriptional activator domain-containing protein [Hymenobacter sp. GOD-10R]WRQ29267.1 bacterial transcriptional activator domain-containing protein [Hymenobacter sp. GOD-10R]